MLAALGKLLRWAAKNIIKVSLLIAILIYLGFEVGGLISHRNAIKGAISVTATAPPTGTTGGTYAYRTKLGAGATSRSATIRWIEVDNRAYVNLSNGQTTDPGWKTYINHVKDVTASGPGVTDIAFSFDADNQDESYTLGDLTVFVRFDYTMFWTTFNLSMEYETKVPVPFQDATTAPQEIDDSAWTNEDLDYMGDEWFRTLEDE